MSYSVFVETCAHTLISPNVWKIVHVCCAIYSSAVLGCCSVEQRERHAQGDVPIHVPGVVPWPTVYTDQSQEDFECSALL